MICGQTPCECFGKPKAPVTARASRNARKRDPAPVAAPALTPIPPEPVQVAIRAPQPQEPAPVIGTDEPPAATFAQIAEHDEEIELQAAIAALMPILHEDDKPKTPAARAAAFRAKRWRERVYG